MCRRCYFNAQSKKRRKGTKGKRGRKQKCQEGKGRNPWTFEKFDCSTKEINFVTVESIIIQTYFVDCFSWEGSKKKKSEKKIKMADSKNVHTPHNFCNPSMQKGGHFLLLFFSSKRSGKENVDCKQ